MSNFKIEFTLKQHTPIIHFQSEQHGATLRATELKPKFDKFLKKCVFGNIIPKNYKISDDKEALNYKIKISPNISLSGEINEKDPLFFGNMGEESNKKRFKNPQIKFNIVFFTYNKELIKIINDNFESFLANTNFGTRQSKGYGSFYLDKEFEPLNLKYKYYKFTSKVDKYKEEIKLLYSFMRQGINLPNREGTRFYAKPSIFLYAKKQGWTWDKKAIKQKYFAKKLDEQKLKHRELDNCINYEANNSFIVRDLFGLSTEQTWMSYGKSVISKENSNIERFKSPITFKPVLIKDNIMDVYFWADSSLEKILNEEFLIKIDKKGDLKLSTPKDFSFDDFFDFTFKIDLSKHIQNEYQSESEYIILNRIFKEIKANK